MSERNPTGDLRLGYQHIPRIDAQFLVEPDSYLDVLLPSTANTQSRLRFHDINDRSIRAIDLSAFPADQVPSGDALLGAPHGAYDEFDLDEEFFVGRLPEHNPGRLPTLEKDVISRKHFSLKLSMGNCGLILAIKDLGSHNGTEIVANATLTPLVDVQTAA